MGNDTTVRSTAGVVLRDDARRYLLVQERNPKAYGLWNLPAGHVDAGESPQEAAVREALEEVGLIVELTDTEPLFYAEVPEKNRIRYAFLGVVKRGILTVRQDELLDAKWLTIEEIEALNLQNKIREAWVMESVRLADKK